MRQKSIIIIIFIAVLFSPLAAILAFQLAYQGKIYPGISVGSQLIGKLTPDQAQLLLVEIIPKISKKLALKHQGQTFLLDLNQLELVFEDQKTTQQAYLFGRQNNWWQNINHQYQTLAYGQRLPLIFTLNQEQLKNGLATVSAQINQPNIPTSLVLAEKEIQVKKGQLGVQVDTLALIKAINQRLAQGNLQEPLNIPVKTAGWLPENDQIQATLDKAQKLKAKSLILTSKEQSFILSSAELIGFLDFSNGWQKEKITAWLSSIAKGIERPAQNALFEFQDNKVVEFAPETDGLELNQQQALGLLLRNLDSLLANNQLQLLLELPIKIAKPEITTADANQFGITGLVGKGESWFYHSIASRIHNIKTGSSKLNGILIKPGEEFSFNRALGEVSAKTGYQQAWIIKDGRTILGDGGGVCQISTTLFRAALNAGLPILKRRAHAYRVSYYEINSPLGLDATVFSPSVDLKFKNDYPCHLLIQTRFDPVSKYLAFSFYGCPDERKVTIGNYQTWSVIPPPPPLYTDDPTLPAGVTKQIDFAAWGAKASFDWKVEKEGETIHQQTFYSNYRPWQAVYLKGTREF